MASETYRLIIGREGKQWTATVEGLPPGNSAHVRFAKMAQVEPTMRDVIASVLGCERHAFDLDVRYVFDGEDVTEAIQTYFVAAAAFEVAIGNRDAKRKTMVDELAEEGMSQRAIAQIIGRSHQRVNQILKDDESPERTDE